MISDNSDLRERMWAKAAIIPEHNPAVIRQDCCGAWIKYDMYGMRDHAYGWEIDHIVPTERLQELNIAEAEWHNELNLRPINCSNNKAKGNDFPTYTAFLTSKGEFNIEDAADYRVNEVVLQQLQDLYKELEI